MLNLLQHLWPDFSTLFTGNPNALSVWFWLVTAAIFVMALLYLSRHFLHFRRRMQAVRSLMDGQSKESLALTRREIVQRARSLKTKDVGMLWCEFDESLVSSIDHTQLFNTLDAEHFFHARTLAPGLTASRLLAATPSFLVALGVLGTFVGLTIGLAKLNIDSRAGVEELRRGIDVLIQGATVAFMTSVWGVTFSLALNVIEKMFERAALGRIQVLQHDIDGLYPRLPAEQSLLQIADYSKESSQALQELHERIGNRLQESLHGMSEAMQQALIEALNTIMAPAIQSLVSTTSQQSTEVLARLVGNFMDGLSSAGREQGTFMQQAAADVHAAVAGLTERLQQLFHGLTEQQMRHLDTAQHQRRQLEELLERSSSSAEQRQQQLEHRFGEPMERLTGQLAGQLGTAHHRDEARQAMFERSLAEAQQQQQALVEQVTTATREQVQTIVDAGTARHNHLEEAFARLMTTLHTQLEAQMSAAEQREQARAQSHAQQQAAALAQHDQMMGSLSATTQQQLHALVETTAAHQRHLETAFGTLRGSLNDQLASHHSNAEQREQARQQRFAEQLDSMASQQQMLLVGIAQAAQTTQEQSHQLAAQHQQLMSHFRQATDAVAASSKHLDSSAHQLGLLAANVRQAADVLGQRLESVTQRIEAAGSQNAQLAAHLQAQASSLSQLQGALLEGTHRFEEAARQARDGFGTMQRHQQEFLAAVRSEFTALGETLCQQVENIEKQAEEWLHRYANEVQQQISERMAKWNEVSHAYADQMLHVVQAVSQVVDELEAR
ncbi:MAG: anti-phage ZorAB system protein ZorA [Candidatus Tectimicrobiota bacterium]